MKVAFPPILLNPVTVMVFVVKLVELTTELTVEFPTLMAVVVKLTLAPTLMAVVFIVPPKVP